MLCWAGGTGAVESTRDPAATFRGKVPHGAEAYAGAAFNATGHAALTVCRQRRPRPYGPPARAADRSESGGAPEDGQLLVGEGDSTY